jgi:transposase
VDYATLGKIQYKKSLNGTETLDFIAGQPVNGQIPKLEIATYTEEKESIVDQPIFPESLKDLVNKNVLEYFRDFEASDILINFRAKSKFFNDFYRYIEAGGDNNYKQAAKLFQTYLKTTTLKNNADLINAFDENAEKLAGSVNFIYATLSRVRKTQYKQFGSVDRTQPDWEAKQIDYMEQAKQKLWTEAQKIIDRTSVSAMEKSTLKSLVEQRILNDAQNFSDIAKILKTSINS